jgi:hypothetical protein
MSTGINPTPSLSPLSWAHTDEVVLAAPGPVRPSLRHVSWQSVGFGFPSNVTSTCLTGFPGE